MPYDVPVYIITWDDRTLLIEVNGTLAVRNLCVHLQTLVLREDSRSISWSTLRVLKADEKSK